MALRATLMLGGPCDGEYLRTTGAPPLTWNVAIPPAGMLTEPMPAEAELPSMLISVYNLGITDDGQPAYYYKGERSS